MVWRRVSQPATFRLQKLSISMNSGLLDLVVTKVMKMKKNKDIVIPNVMNSGYKVKHFPATVNGLVERFRELFIEFIRKGKHKHRNEPVFLLDELLQQERIDRDQYKQLKTMLAESLNEGLTMLEKKKWRSMRKMKSMEFKSDPDYVSWHHSTWLGRIDGAIIMLKDEDDGV